MAVSSRMAPSLENEADAEGDDDGGDKGADEQVAVQEVGDGDAGEDGVREGVTEEGHAAQDNVGAHDGAEHADDDAGEEGTDHEGVWRGRRRKDMAIYVLDLKPRINT